MGKNPTAGPTKNPIPPTICPEKIILHDENRTSIFNSSDKEAIKCYDTSLLTNMAYMFDSATEFNGDVSDWNVSSVTAMEGMFDSATKFNGDVSDWDVSSVTDMNYMFAYTTEFNGAVSDWDVSSVTDMDYMFYDATNFDNSQICNWKVDVKSTSEWLT